MSAVQRHVTTGIWLLTNSGTDGLKPSEVKGHGEPEPARASRRGGAAVQAREIGCSCDAEVPGEAGEAWHALMRGTAHASKAQELGGSSSMRRKSRRSRESKSEQAVREGLRKPRSRDPSKRSRHSSGLPEARSKSRRKHREKSWRRDSGHMEVIWPTTMHAEAYNDGAGYVKGPPEPEQQLPDDGVPGLLLVESNSDQLRWTCVGTSDHLLAPTLIRDQLQPAASSSSGAGGNAHTCMAMADTQMTCCDGSYPSDAEVTPQLANDKHNLCGRGNSTSSASVSPTSSAAAAWQQISLTDSDAGYTSLHGSGTTHAVSVPGGGGLSTGR